VAAAAVMRASHRAATVTAAPAAALRSMSREVCDSRGVSLPERCDRVRRLSAEDDRNCGSRDEAQPRGGKGDGGPGRGA